MRKITTLLAGALLSATALTAAQADDIVVGVSWSNFQEERWKTDEAAIKGALEAGRCQVHFCRCAELFRKAALRC